MTNGEARRNDEISAVIRFLGTPVYRRGASFQLADCIGTQVKNLRHFLTARAEGAFTIIELLIVIIIIFILAALVLAASSYVQNKGARARAETEIAAFSAALESYKADNGTYPSYTSTTGEGHALYQALTGDGNDAIGGSIASTGVAGSASKSYMALRPAMQKPNPPNSTTRVVDPWGFDYFYISPGTNNPTFDLWSTGPPATNGAQNTNATTFIKNW